MLRACRSPHVIYLYLNLYMYLLLLPWNPIRAFY